MIYQQGSREVEVRLDSQQETIWLSLQQIADLFERDKSVISRHFRNIYKDGELNREATVAKNVTVQTEGQRSVERSVEYYNLDAIISVGYRVNSKKGTQFRIWATKTLREYLVQGYAINQQRFDSNAAELQQAIALIQKTAKSSELTAEAGSGLVDIVSRYTQTFLWLQRYDEGLLNDPKGRTGGVLPSAYPTIESKAAHLLYFVVKNHPFSDGNKRSGAFLFVDFLHRNGRLLNTNGEAVINDTGLAALTLLVAESDPKQKETLIRLIMHMLVEKG